MTYNYTKVVQHRHRNAFGPLWDETKIDMSNTFYKAMDLTGKVALVTGAGTGM